MAIVGEENGGFENAAFGSKSKCSNPIPVDQFLKHVITLMETKDGFKNEFISLKVGPRSSVVVSTKDYNLEKNRFVNILAYDRTRVILESDDRSEYVNIKHVKNDYINANYVDGYKKKRQFIASQGPLNTTIIDFWRLVWQNNVSKIVMVTNVVERGKAKCAYYWPHEGSETYGAIKVRLEKEDIYPEYTVRILEMTKGKEKKTLLQFHFTAWPDEGAPTTGTSLLALQDLVNSTPSSNNGAPILIHCSAGIGRTGTYIAVDYLKKQAAEEGIIDVLGCVDRMREDRINMVQSLEQYVYIYTTVLEAVCCGKVRWARDHFPSAYSSLTESSFEGEKTVIDTHFKVLEALKPMSYDQHCEDGREPVNKNKNRRDDIIPSDYVRPYLKVSSDLPADYINAVVVDSLLKKNAYIVTQMPLPNTQIDFWRLVTDYGCICVLMLNEQIFASEDAAPYWPLTSEDAPIICGPFMVKTTAVSDSESTVFTHLNIVSSQSKNEQNLYHFWLKDWPDAEPLPRNRRMLIDLYRQLKDAKILSAEPPLLIHCLFGVEKSGLICAALSLLEAIENSGYVDVFNVVKRIRRSRPKFVATLNQYRFLHALARDFIEMTCSVKVLL